MASTITDLFLTHSTKKLQSMKESIQACLQKLNDDQVWNRGSENENSIGNLILHLCGNARQWIIAGVGGEKDIRDRDKEFAARGGLTRDELLSRLTQTVDQCLEVIATVTPERLTETIVPQTGPVSVLEAIYQVVGHFQQHTGQIIFATKLETGQNLGLTKLPVATTK